MTERIVRLSTVKELTGLGRSTLYRRIKEGTWVPPISLGPRAVGFRESEVAAINAARVRGESDDTIRGLVAALVSDRQNAGSREAA